MARKQNKDQRKSISSATKLKLWVKSGGRCEMKHCNRIVYQDGLTLSDGNFADVAHIIGAKKDGPRGDEKSEQLQIEYSNLMLLCKSCHKLIDSYEKKYGVDLLRKWKTEHEDRIGHLTGISPEVPFSTTLKFQINIGDRTIGIADQAMYAAMFDLEPPKYPADLKGVRIVEDDFDLKSKDQAYWLKFAEDKIKKRIQLHLERNIDGSRPEHLSIFSIGPIPLIMYLGKCIGDTIHADIFHPNRNITDTSKTWSWPKKTIENLPPFLIETVIEQSSEEVAILLSISDTIGKIQYQSYQDSGYSIYRITVKEPSIHLIQSPLQIQEFSRKYRKLLNDIQFKHGENCTIHLLPAVPASIAVECGRVLIPTKDSNIFACQVQENKDFFPVLKLL